MGWDEDIVAIGVRLGELEVASNSLSIRRERKNSIDTVWILEQIKLRLIDLEGGGNGGSVIDHTNLLNIGTNTHTQIDNHIASTSDPHDITWAQIDKTTSDIADITTKSHTSLTDIGTDSHVTIDAHIDDLTIHFTEATIDHGSIDGLGDDDHPHYLLVADIDDTPVDSEVAQPISSNWAFDHVGAADPHTGYRLESADHSHQSTGAQAGKLDHGLALNGLGDDDHTQYHTDARGDARYYTETELDGGQLDNRYFTEAEHLDSSAGASDSGKPIKLDADGKIDSSMLDDSDVDHGTLGGLSDDDHAQYLYLPGRGGQELGDAFTINSYWRAS